MYPRLIYFYLCYLEAHYAYLVLFFFVCMLYCWVIVNIIAMHFIGMKRPQQNFFMLLLLLLLLKYTMTFSLHQGGVVMSSQIKHTHSHQDTPISPYTSRLSLDFQYLGPFYSLSQPHHVTASLSISM